MSFGLTSQWKTPCFFLRLLPKAERTCLKHDPRCQLNRSQPACPEYLGSACARQPIVWLVQHTAEASKIGDVKTPLQLRRARPELLHSVENLSTRSWKLTLELSPTRSVRRRPTASSPGLARRAPSASAVTWRVKPDSGWRTVTLAPTLTPSEVSVTKRLIAAAGLVPEPFPMPCISPMSIG